MKNTLKITILLVLSSCFPEGDSGDITFTTLINNSGHDIELQQFINGTFQSVNFIKNNDNYEYREGSSEPGSGPNGPWVQPMNSADSIWIIYFEKASIWHTTDINSPVSRSLMFESSYEGGKVRDGLYEFTYTFTPEDYEEALEFGD